MLATAKRLADGSAYLMPHAFADENKLGGYETWRARSAYLAEDSAAEITATLLDLLTTLK